eukprot:9468764-Alexandrium_andersonii.AAC.1
MAREAESIDAKASAARRAAFKDGIAAGRGGLGVAYRALRKTKAKGVAYLADSAGALVSTPAEVDAALRSAWAT